MTREELIEAFERARTPQALDVYVSVLLAYQDETEDASVPFLLSALSTSRGQESRRRASAPIKSGPHSTGAKTVRFPATWASSASKKTTCAARMNTWRRPRNIGRRERSHCCYSRPGPRRKGANHEASQSHVSGSVGARRIRLYVLSERADSRRGRTDAHGLPSARRRLPGGALPRWARREPRTDARARVLRRHDHGVALRAEDPRSSTAGTSLELAPLATFPRALSGGDQRRRAHVPHARKRGTCGVCLRDAPGGLQAFGRRVERVAKEDP